MPNKHKKDFKMARRKISVRVCEISKVRYVLTIVVLKTKGRIQITHPLFTKKTLLRI